MDRRARISAPGASSTVKRQSTVSSVSGTGGRIGGMIDLVEGVAVVEGGMGETPCQSGTGDIVGQKPPLKPREVWSIRTRLEISGSARDLALSDLAIDSKLRGCDLVALRVGDVAPRVRCVTVALLSREDAKTRAIRNHRADEDRRSGVDRSPRSQRERLPLSQSGSFKAAFIDACYSTASRSSLPVLSSTTVGMICLPDEPSGRCRIDK